MSISSLYWRKDARYIDNDKIEIVFESDDNRTSKRIYNLKRLEFEENTIHRTLKDWIYDNNLKTIT